MKKKTVYVLVLIIVIIFVFFLCFSINFYRKEAFETFMNVFINTDISNDSDNLTKYATNDFIEQCKNNRIPNKYWLKLENQGNIIVKVNKYARTESDNYAFEIELTYDDDRHATIEGSVGYETDTNNELLVDYLYLKY